MCEPTSRPSPQRRHRAVYIAPTTRRNTNNNNRHRNAAHHNFQTNEQGGFVFPSVTPLPTVRTNPDLELRRSFTSTPSRSGSARSSFSSRSSSFQQAQQSFHSPLLPQYTTTGNARSISIRTRIRRSKAAKYIRIAYRWITDVLLLLIVCIMGFFYDMEVNVVKTNNRQGGATTRTGSSSGGGRRIVIQRETVPSPPQTAPQDESHHYQQQWSTASALEPPRSSDFLALGLDNDINDADADYLTQQHTPMRERRWDPV